jgi:hypothetical protein
VGELAPGDQEGMLHELRWGTGLRHRPTRPSGRRSRPGRLRNRCLATFDTNQIWITIGLSSPALVIRPELGRSRWAGHSSSPAGIQAIRPTVGVYRFFVDAVSYLTRSGACHRFFDAAPIPLPG